MPYGLLIDAGVVLIGALIGLAIGKSIPDKMKETLTCIFGLITLAMGITMIVGVSAMASVGLSLILGTVIGEALNVEDKLIKGLEKLQKALFKGGNAENIKGVMMLIPLLCVGTPLIVGSMNEALDDHELLLVKSVLDLFTAMIFAANYGALVACLSVPVVAVGLLFFFLSSILMPYLTPSMIADLNATGGVHCLACGLGIIGIKKMRVNNIIPALLLALPISWVWSLLM